MGGFGDIGNWLSMPRPDGSSYQMPSGLAPLLQQGMGAMGQPPPAQPQGPTMPAMQPPSMLPIPRPHSPYDLAPQATAYGNSAGQAAFADQRLQLAKQQQQQQANEQILIPGMEAAQADYTKAEDAHAKRIQEIQQRADDLRQQVVAYGQQEVDPGRAFRSAGTWGRIAMGIDMALGGMLGVMNHGQNPVLPAIQKIIDDDISSQEHTLSRRAAALQTQIGMNKEDRANADDEFKDSAVRRATAWEFVKQKALVAGQQSTDQIVQLEAQKISTAADKERDKALLDAGKIDVEASAKVMAAEASVRAASVRAASQERMQHFGAGFYPMPDRKTGALVERPLGPVELPKAAQQEGAAYKSFSAPGADGAAGGEILGRGPQDEAIPLGSMPNDKKRRDELQKRINAAQEITDNIAALKYGAQNYNSLLDLHPNVPGWRNELQQRLQSLSSRTLLRISTAYDKLGSRPAAALVQREAETLGRGYNAWLGENPIPRLESETAAMRNSLATELINARIAMPPLGVVRKDFIQELLGKEAGGRATGAPGAATGTDWGAQFGAEPAEE